MSIENDSINNSLSNLLDSIYELEGLVQLSINKPSELNNFIRLIHAKLNVVENRINDVDNILEIQNGCQNMPDDDVVDENNVDSMDNQDYLYEEAEDSIPVDIDNGIIAALNGQSSSLQVDNYLEEEEADFDYDSSDEKNAYLEPIDATNQEENIEHPGICAQPQEESLNMAVASKNADLPSNLFTINDKFRFTATLFHRNRKEMDEALNIVDDMKNFAEVEDYFYNALGWDRNGDEVTDFMAILSRWFDN